MFQALFPPQKINPFCLYFDPVGDYVSMPDSAFYDFGLDDFTLWIRVFLVDANPNSGDNSTQDLIGKREQNDRKYVISCVSSRIIFVIDNSGSSGSGASTAIQTTAVFPLGRFVDIIARRNGGMQNNGAYQSYQLFFDGVQQDVINLGAATSTNFNATFAAPFTFQSSNTSAPNVFIRRHMFISGAGCWSRALSDNEVTGISAGQIPPDSGKGYWPFSQTSGKSVGDYSSVQKTGTLNNYTDAETGIPDSATNRVWFAEEAIFFLSSTQSTASKAIKQGHQATGFRTFGTFQNPVTWALLDASGNPKTSGTLPAGAGSYTPILLPISGGDTLSFSSTGIDAAANCAVGVLWAA